MATGNLHAEHVVPDVFASNIKLAIHGTANAAAVEFFGSEILSG